MTFSDHKIQSFAKKLTDLPDQPNLSASKLKAYFDSSPEELRQAHNALCIDAERLDSRVSGIVAETFGDAIPKTMLSDELQKEIDAKAEQSAVAAEMTARQLLETRMQQAETQLVRKCEVVFGRYVGTYSGTGENSSQYIPLGFAPLAVLVISTDGQSSSKLSSTGAQLALPGHSAAFLSISGDGFNASNQLNHSDGWGPYHYIAFKPV